MVNKDGKRYVPIWMSYESYFEPLSDAEVGRLIRAMMEYESSGATPELKGNERYIWPAIRRDMDASAAKQGGRSETNRQNALKRWENEKTGAPDESEPMQPDTNPCERCNRKRKGKRKGKGKREREQGRFRRSAGKRPSTGDNPAAERRHSLSDPDRAMPEMGGAIPCRGYHAGAAEDAGMVGCQPRQTQNQTRNPALCDRLACKGAEQRAQPGRCPNRSPFFGEPRRSAERHGRSA